MLKQRVITAIVLLMIFLPALFYPSPTAFFIFTLILITAGAWEWGRLTGITHLKSLALAATVFIACALAWGLGALDSTLTIIWIFAGFAWVFSGAFLLFRGPGLWTRIPRFIRLLAGVLILVFAWLAMAHARQIGVNFLLSILALVWMADIAAYFAGRALGGRFFRNKLAPSISPGKSWEGVFGGLLGVILLTFIWLKIDQAVSVQSLSFFSSLRPHGHWYLMIGVILLTCMSVVGDLIESLMKRGAGVKDSSGLLPGHGGVLDRLDALLPTLPIAMMMYSLGQI
jgi:phosphatidate cytidylyltransferase